MFMNSIDGYYTKVTTTLKVKYRVVRDSVEHWRGQEGGSIGYIDSQMWIHMKHCCIFLLKKYYNFVLSNISFWSAETMMSMFVMKLNFR